MKDFRNDTWSMFNMTACGKKVIIFGASSLASVYINYGKKLNSRWEVERVVDNDVHKQGKKFEGYFIEKPDVIMEYGDDGAVILICSLHTAEIAKQLEKMRVKNYFSVYWMDAPIKVSYEQLVPEEEVKWLKENVCDEVSIDVIEAIAEKRKNNIMDYSDIKYFGESEYFISEFWAPYESGKDVFIDGGGYTGDTIEEFINWTKGKYKAIYSFEPDLTKARIIEENLWKWDKKVHFYQKGLYDKETRLSFVKGTELFSGKIADTDNEAADTIETVALDAVVKEPVTFLKLDIEGAEIKALEGAKEIITKDKPRLAICAYHKLNDLWEIPKLILQMVPEYKFRIRHCGMRCRGTILYASVDW